ncbi:MAG: hypothetical protein WC483_04230 [Candidatus Paceibacterota bacterium]
MTSESSKRAVMLFEIGNNLKDRRRGKNQLLPREISSGDESTSSSADVRTRRSQRPSESKARGICAIHREESVRDRLGKDVLPIRSARHRSASVSRHLFDRTARGARSNRSIFSFD